MKSYNNFIKMSMTYSDSLENYAKTTSHQIDIKFGMYTFIHCMGGHAGREIDLKTCQLSHLNRAICLLIYTRNFSQNTFIVCSITSDEFKYRISVCSPSNTSETGRGRTFAVTVTKILRSLCLKIFKVLS